MMILFRTLLNRTIWLNPLSNVIGDWWIYMMSQSSNVDTNDLTYLSESGMQGLTFMNFSQNGNKDDDSDK